MMPLRVVNPLEAPKPGHAEVLEHYLKPDVMQIQIEGLRTKPTRVVGLDPALLQRFGHLRGQNGSSAAHVGTTLWTPRASRLAGLRPAPKVVPEMECTDPHWPVYQVDADQIMSRMNDSVDFLRNAYPVVPNACVMLGSGLGDVAVKLFTDLGVSPDKIKRIPYADGPDGQKGVPHFVKPKIAGHRGELVVGELFPGFHVAFLCGRTHGYEHFGGLANPAVTFSTRVMAKWGVPTMISTSAVGGIQYPVPGTIVMLRDHINLGMGNPLQGDNLSEMGPRFPDMTYAYDSAMRQLVKDVANQKGIRIEEGVYAGMLGPTYETPAEIRMLQGLKFDTKAMSNGLAKRLIEAFQEVLFQKILAGAQIRLGLKADVVGMSNVGECIVANHSGMKYLAFGLVSNAAAGILDQPLNHEEVEREIKKALPLFVSLLQAVLAEMAKQTQK